MRCSLVLLLGGFVLAGGCVAADDHSGDVGKPSATESTLLYRDDLGADHAIEYHAFGAILAVRETMSMDGGEASLLDKVGRAESLTAVFQRIHPDVSAPEVLVDADRDSAAQQAQLASMPPPDLSSLPAASRPTQSALTCSSDAFGDNWGASWFLNNFCNTGNFRECHTNWGWFDDWHQTSWNSYRQFEGDFSNNGHISGDYWSCFWSLFTGWSCFWIQSMDHDLLPRHVESWTTTGSDGGWVRFSGTSQCGHLGVAFLWNS